MGLDITGPFPLTGGKYHQAIQHKLFWYGINDHFSKKMISSFRYTKSELVAFVNEACTFMISRGTPIQAVRMDNAGENIAVRKFCEQNNIKIEYTPPQTPNLNGIIERAFAIRWEKAQILMQNAGIKDEVKRNKKILVQAINAVNFFT